MKLPNFLIIGAAKSGTTSLASYLSQHPDVFMSRTKEPNYFALAERGFTIAGPAPSHVLAGAIYNWSRTNWSEYCQLFEGAEMRIAVGEASVRYLYFEDAALRIKTTLPDVRLIVLLRDPVSRLYSHYNMNRAALLEPLTLTEAIAAESERIAAGWGWDWHYVQAGLYAKQLRRYFNLFESKQIAVFFYDDFRSDPRAVFRAVCRHIGVDEKFLPNMLERAKQASWPRSAALARWLSWPSKTRYQLIRYGRPFGPWIVNQLKNLNSAPVPELDPALRSALIPFFRSDLEELSTLLKREIPWYRSNADQKT